MSLHAWWHIATINNWYEIVYEQLGKLVGSGLLGELESLNVGVLGDIQAAREVIPFGGKICLQYHSSNVREYEIATVRKMDTWARNPGLDGSHRVLYLHVKGAGREDLPSQHNVSFWRRYMEYFVLERWRDCAAALADCDACGVDLNFGPWPHFSGNFWWSTVRYLRTLPPASGLTVADPVRVELRIGESSGPMRLHELWHGGKNLYSEKILPAEYRGQCPKMPQGVSPWRKSL